MKKILSPAYSLKLKSIILFLTVGLIFIFLKWSQSQCCFNVVLSCENLRWKLKLCFDKRCSNQLWNKQRWFDVVQRYKFQCWCTQRCFIVDLTLCDFVTSYQPNSSVETTFKCLLGWKYIFYIFSQIVKWEKKSQMTCSHANNDYKNVVKSIKVTLNSKHRTN